MSDGQHQLSEEFPEFKEKIHSLKVQNAHFRKLFDGYQDVTRAISRSEQRIDLLSEREEEDLRKQRLRLKDEIYAILKAD